MNNPFFSVIVPTHNSSGYIRKLLQSIADQKWKDYELIVACDACEDDTADIAMEYGAKVITVSFNQDGATRNAAMDIATGEWILFADDDDWFLHEYVFDQLALMAGQHDEDILLFSFIWKGRGYAYQTERRRYYAPWNKCYRHSFVGNTRFSEEVIYGSDVQFYNELFGKNPKCYYWNMPLYYYNFMREGSLTFRYKQGEFDEQK